MSASVGNAVRHFMRSCGMPTDLPMDTDDRQEVAQWLTRFQVATDDLEAAVSYRERAFTAKQAADLVYLVVALCETFGLKFDDVFAEVHRSNLSRIDPATGQPYDQEDNGHVNRGPEFYDPMDAIGEIVDTV